MDTGKDVVSLLVLIVISLVIVILLSQNLYSTPSGSFSSRSLRAEKGISNPVSFLTDQLKTTARKYSEAGVDVDKFLQMLRAGDSK